MRPLPLLLALALALGGCRKAPPPIPPGPPTDAELAAAEAIYRERCSNCHGPEGRGDGASAQGLVPPPRNYHDPVFQRSVTDEHLEQIIEVGGAELKLSASMPPNPDLWGQKVVRALRMKVRSFGSSP